MAALTGKPIDGAALEAALAAVQEDVKMAPNAPGAGSRRCVSSFLCLPHVQPLGRLAGWQAGWPAFGGRGACPCSCSPASRRAS